MGTRDSEELAVTQQSKVFWIPSCPAALYNLSGRAVSWGLLCIPSGLPDPVKLSFLILAFFFYVSSKLVSETASFAGLEHKSIAF